MKFRLIAVAFSLASTAALGGQSAAVSCLSKPDPKNCLADVAVVALASDRDAGSRLEGVAALLTTLAKSDMRRDDILAIAKDDETVSISARWTLAIARNTYAFRFGLPPTAQDHPERLKAMGESLRSRSDGMERFGVMIAACEAVDRESMPAREKWNGALDGFCSMTQSDVEAMEREFPGLSVMTEPLIAAYQGNHTALSKSLESSVALLGQYQKILDRKLPAKERELVHQLLFFGNILNAWALATANQGGAAVKAAERALENLRKSPSADQAKEIKLIKSMTSWIYAKAGLHDDAKKMVTASLEKFDRKKNTTGGDVAVVISMVIETLQEIEAQK